jgi:surface protein
MEDMFRGCQNFNQPIGSLDVSNVTKMRDMLESAYAMEDKHKSGKVIKAH